MDTSENYFKCCKVNFIANYDREEGTYLGGQIFRNCTFIVNDKAAILHDQKGEVLGVFSLDTSFIVTHHEH